MKATTLQTHITLFWTIEPEEFLWDILKTVDGEMVSRGYVHLHK